MRPSVVPSSNAIVTWPPTPPSNRGVSASHLLNRCGLVSADHSSSGVKS